MLQDLQIIAESYQNNRSFTELWTPEQMAGQTCYQAHRQELQEHRAPREAVQELPGHPEHPVTFPERHPEGVEPPALQ